MRTTIDKAGRVVIPAAIRDRAGLSAGAELDVTEDELGILPGLPSRGVTL